MPNYYDHQFEALNSNGTPLPRMKFIDKDGNATHWMSCTIEGINSALKYLEREKQKRIEAELLIIN